MSRSNDIAGLTTSILDGVTATEVGLGNGHIVQSVFNPSITNTSTSIVNNTTSAGRADVIGQITINSGNGVLIYLKCDLLISPSSTSYGRVEIREGTVASLGSILTKQKAGLNFGTTCTSNFSFFAYDSSPADTTPDYCVAIATDSSGTNYVQFESFDATVFSIYLFEVKQ
tara:strand:- start:4110 stop:4622 length:513 start_codon:yes stop_codon:yes gene_type:complete